MSQSSGASGVTSVASGLTEAMSSGESIGGVPISGTAEAVI
jgi:hypothetical protein